MTSNGIENCNNCSQKGVHVFKTQKNRLVKCNADLCLDFSINYSYSSIKIAFFSFFFGEAMITKVSKGRHNIFFISFAY